MKSDCSNIIILFIVIVVACQTQKSVVSTNIFKKQNVVGKGFADSAKWTRDDILSKYSKTIFPCDTLFLIERIGEPSLEVWGNIWTSKRNVVYEYEREYETFKDTVLNYNLWNSRYKTNVEQFDTTTIDKHKILGGYRTFITQVIRGKEVKTFYFYDSYSSLNINNYKQKSLK